MLKKAALCVICVPLAACSVKSGLPLGPQSYAVIPAEAENPEPLVYRIGPLDLLDVTVFREPQLSVTKAQVDSAGDVVLPLIGKVHAGDKTPGDLSAEVQTAYGRFLRVPRVSITVASNSQTIAVEGSVNAPGIYAIPGRSSLIEAMALAKSPTEIAANDEVLVFRKIDGRRAAARFDIRRIRMGLDPDPVILPGDRVVVGYHGMKEAWRDYYSKLPFYVFRWL